MIVGTAGHIDHGKTSLVKAITGIDADRLKEEKERGITIELGFAYWPQPDKSVIGFVDVPGHERLVHTMLAGAHGIDRVLFVVAADDGVMPQTLEHLEIATLLGLDRGAVALTKVDAVAPERVAAVAQEVHAALESTTLADSPIFAVSSVTGEGLPALTGWLRQEQALLKPRDEHRLFRLAIDRAFLLQGAGVVAAGMVLDGTVSVGDEVVLSPRGLIARVRSLHAQNRREERGHAGQRCALNLVGSGVSKETVRRGDMIISPAAHAPTQRIDVALRVAPGAAKGVGQWMPARLHHASAEVGARIVLLEDRRPQPGDLTRVQLVLDEPVQAQALDRFILRDVSASRTLGGGRFLDLRAPDRRRRTPERVALLAAMARTEPVPALAGVLHACAGAVDLAVFTRDRGATLAQGVAWCEAAEGEAIAVGRQIFAVQRARRTALADEVHAALETFHASHPDVLGIGRDRLHRQTVPRFPAPLFSVMLRSFAAEGWLSLDGSWVRLASHSVEITLEEENLWHEIPTDALGRAIPPAAGA